jgi:hypothetical protein
MSEALTKDGEEIDLSIPEEHRENGHLRTTVVFGRSSVRKPSMNTTTNVGTMGVNGLSARMGGRYTYTTSSQCGN